MTESPFRSSVRPVSRARSLCLFWASLQLWLGAGLQSGVWAAEDPARADGPPEARSPLEAAAAGGALDALLERLRAEFPDRQAVHLGGPALPRALREFADRHADDAALASDVGRARQLAAEAYTVLGDRRAARQVYSELANRGPLEEHRGLGLFVLGEEQFFSERYVWDPRVPKSRQSAEYYWRLLRERFPESPFTSRIDRPMRYIELAKESTAAPSGRSFSTASIAFSEVFERRFPDQRASERVSLSSDDLRGRVVLISFWTAATPQQDVYNNTLASGLASNLEEYADLRGKVQALGVNLDTSRELFEAALAAWGSPWPECHDGKGFETPLAVTFAIPRAPHWVVVSHEGRLVYIGAAHDRFLSAASAQLRRVRGVAEERAPGSEREER